MNDRPAHKGYPGRVWINQIIPLDKFINVDILAGGFRLGQLTYIGGRTHGKTQLAERLAERMRDQGYEVYYRPETKDA